MTESIYRYWGKADPDYPGEPKWHPLAYHCLDVAAVGHLFLQCRPGSLERISTVSGIPEKHLLPWLTFLLAIHDIGKFSDGFQNQRSDLFQSLQGRTTPATYTEHHSSIGYRCFNEELIGVLLKSDDKYVDVADLSDLLMPWIAAVTGHHGRPPQTEQYPQPLNKQFTAQVKEDVLKYIGAIQTKLLTQEIPFNTDDYNLLENFKRASWMVAGLAVAADWIGSNQRWFQYCDGEIPLDDYWDTALSSARVAVAESGLRGIKPASFSGIGALFPKIEVPTPLQQLAETISIPEGPQLYLIEEVTGGGKTEAALALAHRLMGSGLAEGIYLALPTMATANAMHKRIRDMYRRLFTDANPSLVLAHSANRMVLEMEIKNRDDAGYGKDGRSASQDCSDWLSDSRKKALLADVGVGTIDQALLSILSVRHQSLRLFGLANKVLVVDEVHACDAYVLRLLSTLLRFHAAFGGSAILLSATLPQTMRAQLVKAFAGGADFTESALTETRYPLLTQLSGDALREHPFAARVETSRTVNVEALHNISEVVERLQSVIDAGGCACWVRNTVYDAMKAYSEWVTSLGEERGMLFHARFALGDRLQIEQEVLRFFGRDSTSGDRQGKLLIATQVVEQSLDIDFDYMVSDLAPVDLLIQRAGRLKRHTRDFASNLINGPDQRGAAFLGVFMPEATEDAEADWYKKMFPKTVKVYSHHGQLWLTARWLQNNKRFSMPQDAREIIEYVYGDVGRQSLPAALQKIEERAEGDDKGNSSMGSLNSLNLDEGYKATMFHWQDDTNAPTRLGEPTTMVRLARWNGGKLEPWVTGTGHDWELSQLAMRQTQIKAETPGFEAAIDTVRQTMPDEGRYCVVIPLTKDGEKWVGQAINGYGETVKVEYTSRTGLQIKEEDV